MSAREVDWAAAAERLAGKRVMVVWGQGAAAGAGVAEAYDRFAADLNVASIADHLANVHHPTSVPRPFALLVSGASSSDLLRADIVITVGGNTFLIDHLKRLLGKGRVEHWRVDADGEVVDPFKRLTDVFEALPADFFRRVAEHIDSPTLGDYAKRLVKLVSAVPLPTADFGELAVIERFLTSLPVGSALHIANSAPIRMAHLFEIDESIRILGNRGVNGIDGSMSSTIGYATGSGRLTFLLIGDLSFFYDMNSLWIRHRPENLRILIVNNGGGALMHSAPLTPERAEIGARHISAGHSASVRGWVESLGIEYLTASDAAGLSSALHAFFDPTSSRATVLEVFTEKIADIEQFKAYNAEVSTLDAGLSPYRRARRAAGKTLKLMGLR